jgi:hypothetical protein
VRSQRPRLPLEVLPEALAICRLPAGAPVPKWADNSGKFLTISRTAEELSITALQGEVPADVRCERDYRAIRVHRTLPTTLVGILLSIAKPLADAGLSIFAISTYDTDYVLVKERDLATALEAYRAPGTTSSAIRTAALARSDERRETGGWVLEIPPRCGCGARCPMSCRT